MNRSRLFSCLFLLQAAAFAQPGPPGAVPNAPPPDFATFAAEVRARPTDAKSVHPRFHQLMDALRFERVPPDPKMRGDLDEIRRLLGAGSLTKAAHLVDRVVIGTQTRVATAVAAAAAAPAAAPTAQSPSAGFSAAGLGIPELASQAPALLSSPTPASAAAPRRGAASDDGAFSRPTATFGRSARTSAASAAPEASSGLLIAVLAGCTALLGAGLLLAAAHFSRGAKRSTSRRPFAPLAPLAPPMPAAKTLANRYTLERSIASGGMGEVYEGRDLSLGRRVAIKRMLSDIKLDAGMRSQFLNEARTVAKLSHPYIVPIHECLDNDGDLYLVFEFFEGETLARRLAREARLPLKECRRILGYVGAAVDHAHKNHVLHRDLKPANIMLDSGGIARIMDFGIALESTRVTASSGSSVIDASGTLRYMPPEQHYGKSVRASDIYAMGVCLYEMATGHPPFAAGTIDELIAAKRARRYPSPSSLRSELPKEFDLFIAATLEPDAQNRVSNASEFAELLDAIPV